MLHSSTYRYLFLFFFLSLSGWDDSLFAQCSNVTPSFTYTVSRNCGFPRFVTFTNTSTGTASNTTHYSWMLNGSLKRRITGKTGLVLKLDTPNVYTFTLVAWDSVGSCRDSSKTTYTLSSPRPRKIRDQSGTLTFTPAWYNCIYSVGSPDTFSIRVQPSDTISNYRIKWGDGKADNTGTRLLSSQSVWHRYDSLGVFNYLVIYDNGTCLDTIFGTVANERQPVAGIIGPPTGQNQGCIPFKIRFVNNSSQSSSATTFTWEMGDGKTLIWPAKKFKDTLFYTYTKYLCSGIVKVTAKNGCGSSFATWNPVQASSRDSAIINLANPNNCDVTKDFIFSPRNIDRYCIIPDYKHYRWIWGDGTSTNWTTSTAQVLKKYSKKGSYSILMIDSNGCGKDTAKLVLDIVDPPKADFDLLSNDSGCAAYTVKFNNKSSGAAITYNWNFTTGTSTQQNPTFTYTAARTTPYRIVLEAKNRCGSSFDTAFVRVFRKTAPSFDLINSVGCAPLSVRFTNRTDASNALGIQYLWDFGNGQTSKATSPSAVVYPTPGKYTVTLYTTDSCGRDSFKRTFTVTGPPDADFLIPATGICPKTNFTLKHASSTDAIKFAWNFGDGTTLAQSTRADVVKKFDSLKTYAVRLIAENIIGCRDTIIKNIRINPQPTINYTIGTAAGCAPLLSTFTNSSQHNGSKPIDSMTFVWTFGKNGRSSAKDTSFSFPASLKKDTVHSIKLLGINSWGCRDSITKTILVYPNPSARFSLDLNAGCSPLKVSTTNTSIPNDTGTISIMKFRWMLRNGLTAASTDTSVTLAASKTKDTLHQIKLYAFSEHGCLDSTTLPVRVFPNPRVAFTPSASVGCRPLKVSFANKSLPMDTGSIAIMKFKWLFPAMDTSNLTNSSYTFQEVYQRDTTYNIKLIGTNEHGCRDSVLENITLRPDAKSSFQASTTTGCGPLPVKFTFSALNAGTSTWMIDGKTVATTKDLNHSFRQRPIFDSVYKVSLHVTSPYGCRGDTSFMIITVKGDPVADFLSSKDTFCFPDRIQMFNTSLNAYRYNWTLAKGVNSKVVNPTAYFVKSTNPRRDSTHIVSLEATSVYGCKDTIHKTVTVLPYPVANFTSDKLNGCAPLTVKFTNLSINARDQFWDMGNGFSANTVSTTHTYYNRGPRDTIYKVILYTYSADCIDTQAMNIPVYKPTEAVFKFDRVHPCDAGYFDFYNESLFGHRYIWDFNDGTRDTAFSPRHLFPVSSYRDTTFKVKLISITNSRCRDSIVRNVLLPQRLQMSVLDTNYRVCIPGVVSFRNFTKGAVSYIWNFGDGGGSSLRNPVYEYNKPGVYGYSLTGFDMNGCRDSFISKGRVTVAETPIAQIDHLPMKGKMPNSGIYFYSRSTSRLPMNFFWDFGDAGNADTSNLRDPYYAFSDSGWYKVMHVVGNGVCYDTATVNIRIDPYDPIPEFYADVDSGCVPFVIKFKNQTQFANRFVWYFGDGNKSTDKEPTHIYKEPGEFTVLLIGFGPGGEGRNEKPSYIKVMPKPYAVFQLTPKLMYLPDAEFYTRNLTTNSVSQTWDVYNKAGQNKGNSTRFEPMFRLTDTGFFDVRLIAVSKFGCTDTTMLRDAVFVSPNGRLFVPTAFTPNANNMNDVFRPLGTNISRDHYILRIYNSWGAKVYETTNPEEGWDGTLNGKPCMNGVYVWKVNVRFIDGIDNEQKGVVHLIR